MSTETVAQFLSRHSPLAQEREVWGRMPLAITYYLTSERPPDETITSVRGVVLQKDQVLVIQDGSGSYHLVPGGRREPGESLVETLHREVFEETGWLIAEPRYFAFAHFRHLAPRPPNFPHPYPEFCQLFYAARAMRPVPQAQIADDYVVTAGLKSQEELIGLNITKTQLRLLEAAREALSGS